MRGRSFGCYGLCVRADRFRVCLRLRFRRIRLQDLNLSYSFPARLIGKVGISGLRLYVSASNVFFWAPEWQFSDPEVRSYSSPQLPRSVTFGLNLKF